MPDILLIKENSKVVEGTSWIILINKRVFRETVEDHLSLFQEKLGNISSEELLTSLETGSSSFQNMIGGSDILLGILLGYGEHNCKVFEERKNDEKRERACSYISKKSALLNDFSTNEHALKSRCNSLQPINHQSYVLKVNPVSFCADVSHSETKPLAEKYRKLNSKITKLYNDKNVLQTTLSILMQNP